MPAAGRGGERRRIRPGGLGPGLDRHRHQSGVLDDGVHLLALEAVVVGEVRAGGHAHRGAGLGDQAPRARGVVEVVVEQRLGDGALGEVVDPLPAAAFGADHVAGVQQPLHGDLGLGPVPPLAAVATAAQLGGGERAVGPEAVQDGGAGARGVLHDVPAVALGAPGAAAEGEERPLLDGQDAGGVRPVLEAVRSGRGVALGGRRPVGALDGRAADRAEAGVGDELVGAGQHGDRVELDGAEVAQHAADAGPAVRCPEQALRPQRQSPGVVGGQVGHGAWCGLALRHSGHGAQRRGGH